MTVAFGPERWAIEITKLLNLVLGPEHFPIDVIQVAREYSAQRFPGDAITLAEGANLPGFDGALYRAPTGKTGWGIIYNNALASPGRIILPLPTSLRITYCTAPTTRTAFAVASKMSFGGIPPTGKSSTKRTGLPLIC